MKDKPNEVIELDDDDEGKRSKSVVRSPWPAGHKLIGPAGPPPKDEVPPVILRVLEAAQLRIDQIQLEQLRDEEESNWTYAVAVDRSRSIQKIIKETIDTCGGFLTPPIAPAVIKLTDVLKFKLSRDVQGWKGKVHYCSYCGSPFHGHRVCDDARNLTDPGRHALAIPDRDSVRGFEDSDYPGWGANYSDVFTPRRYDLLHTLQVVKVDKPYNIWIYPFDVPVGGGVSA